MQEVIRFTTEFIPDQDRIRVALEGNKGQVRLIWLTRRLLMRLLPQLLEAFAAPAAVPQGSAGRHQAQQGFNQQAAVSAIRRQKPVRAADPEIPRDPDLLVWAVDIQKTTRQVTLVFRSKDQSQSQILPFAVPALRQWLAVLHGQFAKADWSAAFWPSWIAPRPADQGISKLN